MYGVITGYICGSIYEWKISDIEKQKMENNWNLVCEFFNVTP
jgi:hypothetical protein